MIKLLAIAMMLEVVVLSSSCVFGQQGCLDGIQGEKEGQLLYVASQNDTVVTPSRYEMLPASEKASLAALLAKVDNASCDIVCYDADRVVRCKSKAVTENSSYKCEQNQVISAACTAIDGSHNATAVVNFYQHQPGKVNDGIIYEWIPWIVGGAGIVVGTITGAGLTIMAAKCWPRKKEAAFQGYGKLNEFEMVTSIQGNGLGGAPEV